MTSGNKSRFLLKNLGRGLLWLSIIVIAYILLKDSEFMARQDWLKSISENYVLVYLVFLFSEVVFGLIPPEIFIIWSVSHSVTSLFVLDLLILALISYSAGVLGYYIGITFSHTKFFKKIYDRYLEKYENNLRKYSGFLLFVAAVTPLPYSAMCMLIGTINYPKRYFYLITLARIGRFFVYGYVILSANMI